jgi:hypothetical protein
MAHLGWAADPLDTWTLVSPLPTAHDLYGITSANGRIVAVGAGGTIAASKDGITWTAQQWDETNSSRAGYYFRGVTCGGGEFAIVGKQSFLPVGSVPEIWSTAVLSSSDGTNWVAEITGMTNFLNGVTWGNGQFVAVGDQGTILTSADAITWNAAASPTRDALNAVVWQNGLFVAVGAGGTIVSSSDGQSWSPQASGITNWYGGGLQTIAYGNDQFVAGGIVYDSSDHPTTAICTSPDGLNWTLRNAGTSWTLTGLAYGNGRFVGVGMEGIVLTSTNGVDWTSAGYVPCRGFEGLAWVGNQFVAVGAAGTISTSVDGVSWTQRNSGGPWSLFGVGYGDGLFVAVGESGVVLTPDESDVWIQSGCQGGDWLEAVTDGAGRFVAVGLGSASVSSDGLSWGPRQRHGGVGVTWGNGLFVAVGDAGGTILTSVDGMKWTSRNSGTVASLRAVAYGSGRFVAVGDSGTILSSTDGTNWASASTLVTKTLWGVAYGNGRFVAVGASLSGGVAVILPDSGGWGEVDLGRNWPQGIAFGAGQFVAVGASGIISSPDGASWIERLRQGGEAVAYGGGRFVVVGGGGTVLESGAVLVAPTLGPVGLLADGTVQVGVIGTEGQSYGVETSTDLTNWVQFTNVTIVGGVAQFSDGEVTNNLNKRFYRAVAP